MDFFDSSHFRLTAITLRGVGSYIEGCRLEIKPITVICGNNGSGKSTWLKAIQMVAKAVQARKLLFEFGQDAQSMTNAFFGYLECDEQVDSSIELANPWGPPGTIGFEMVAVKEIPASKLSGLMTLNCSPPNGSDRFPVGTEFRVRVAHPRFHDWRASPSHLWDFVEVAINSQVVVQFVGRVDRFQKQDLRSLPMSLLLLGPQGTAGISENQLFHVADVFDGLSRIEVKDANPLQEQFKAIIGWDEAPLVRKLGLVDDGLEKLNNSIHWLLEQVLGGFYPIGPIRDIETSTDRIEKEISLLKDDKSDTNHQRHVGFKGERAWIVFKYFEDYACRAINNLGLRVDDLIPLFGYHGISKMDLKKIQLIWDCDPDFFNSILAKELPDKSDAEIEGEIQEITKVLKRIVHNRTFTKEFLHQIWDRSPLKGFTFGKRIDLRAIKDVELAHYVNLVFEKGVVSADRNNIDLDLVVQRLSPRLIARVNTLILQQILKSEDGLKNNHFPGRFSGDDLKSTIENSFKSQRFLKISDELGQDDISLGQAVNVTLRHLVNHRLYPPRENDGMKSLKEDRQFLEEIFQEPVRMIDQEVIYPPYEQELSELMGETRTFRQIEHGCFGFVQSQSPSAFSAGFHQIFPIVVQSFLARPFEILAIENPEVHLHPGLVRSLVGYLFTLTNSYRYVIVETHSDLLVRRIVRGLLEEEIAQSQTAIYFADLHRLDSSVDQAYYSQFLLGKTKDLESEDLQDLSEIEKPSLISQFLQSKLTKIEFDKNNRISNWPKGFLDEDEDETDKMLDALTRFPPSSSDSSSQTEETDSEEECDETEDETGDEN